MATAYTFLGMGKSMPFDSPGKQIPRVCLDVPDLIANGGLALKATPKVACALPSTGFAANDTLELFGFGKGTLVKRVNCRIATAGNAGATIDAGITGGDIDGFLDGSDITSAGTVYYTLDTVGYGTDTALGYFFAADGNVTIIFLGAAVTTLIADFWAEAAFVAEI